METRGNESKFTGVADARVDSLVSALRQTEVRLESLVERQGVDIATEISKLEQKVNRDESKVELRIREDVMKIEQGVNDWIQEISKKISNISSIV